MSIRNRLTLQFGLLASLVLGIAAMAIYLLSADYRKDEFAQRMQSRGENTAKLFIQVEEVDEDLLDIIERDNPIRLPEEEIVIFDSNDSIIYRTAGDYTAIPTAYFLDQVRAERLVSSESGKREMVSFLFTDKQDRFVVVVSAIDVYGRSKLSNLLQVLLSVMVLGMLSFFIAGRIYAERALNPIKQLVSEITGISVSNLDVRANEGNGQDELAQLAIAFNAMLVRLEAAFKVQRNFIANASHEMRTPLTAISGQLEVLQMKERTTEQYRSAVSSVLNDIHNLNLLANRLLLLAHAGTDAPEASFKPVRLDEILWEARADLCRAHPEYVVDVDFDVSLPDPESLTVNGSDVLLRTMVLNLMDNGCKYSEDHHVMVKVGVEEGYGRLIFADQGIGIAEEDRPHIFEPFFRAEGSRKRDGHGIGLSLVSRIVDLHKGSIQMTSMVNKGTHFTVLLPLNKALST
jgi:signal transduction histidine kinase